MSQASWKVEKSAHRRRASLEEAATAELDRLREAGLERRLRTIDGPQETRVVLDEQPRLLFCSNNYLGLANHPEVVAAAQRALSAFGASAVSSRLISGHMRAHEELEREIAEWKGCEAALVFTSGYQANIGTITSLVGREDVVVSDELNHASIIDGCRLSRARIAIYRHNDVASLREQLHRHADARRILVVTESIFSMDGDRAPLAAIVAAAKEHGAWVMVDEAHAAGIFGPEGAGVVAEEGLTGDVDIHLGTLGKALGTFGAYVAGSRALIDLLINRARSFIFTTGLPPAVAAAARAAIRVVRRDHSRAERLLVSARALGERLRAAGLHVAHLDSQILPILIGDAQATVRVAACLLERGIYIAAIRPPTVPPGTSRLRLSLMATHEDAEIDVVADAIVEVVRETCPEALRS